VALSGDIGPMAALAMLFRFPAWLETGYSALAGGQHAAHWEMPDYNRRQTPINSEAGK